MSAAEAPAEPAGGKEEGRVRRSALWAGAHLIALSCFALAQPLFELLKGSPEFFAARGSSGFDIISFSVLLVLVPPLVLLLVELLVGLVSQSARTAVHLMFVATLVALIAVQALKKSVGGSDLVLIALAILIGALLAALYARAEPVRSFVSVLSLAPLVFLLLFLVASPVSKLAFPSEAGAKSVGGVARAPIVMVLFDELPVTSLQADRRSVDARRFPAFAELAGDATWFKNAYAIYDSTERAQPAIMDGNYPDKEKLPTSADHPDSIFALFAKTHRLNVSEEATSVCSRDFCKDERLEESYGSRLSSLSEDLGLVWLHVVAPPDMEKDLPTVSENFGNFAGGDDAADAGGGGGPAEQPNTRANLNRNRNKRFEAWIDDVKGGARPGLSFKHALLPHVPWQYLPSGKQYRRTARDPVPGLSSEAYNDQGQLDSLYQRHLLQLGFTDRELGRLLRKLKDEGIYDDALIVVAADHGLAFDRGKRDRRKLNRGNAAQIAAIPLFVKAPRQRRAKVDDALVETVDILPTILDVLDVRPPEKMDGSSAFSPKVQRRRALRILERGTFNPIRIAGEQFERERDAQLEKKLRLFGTGREGPGRLFQIGPNQELLGRRVADLDVGGSVGARVKLVQSGEFRRVDLRSPTIPVHVVGRVSGGQPGRNVAIAVNGTIRAVSSTFKLATSSDTLIAAMVPEASFRQGRNQVHLYEVSGTRGALALTPLN